MVVLADHAAWPRQLHRRVRGSHATAVAVRVTAATAAGPVPVPRRTSAPGPHPRGRVLSSSVRARPVPGRSRREGVATNSTSVVTRVAATDARKTPPDAATTFTAQDDTRSKRTFGIWRGYPPVGPAPHRGPSATRW